MVHRVMLVVVAGVVITSVVGLLAAQPAEAGHNGSLCKWGFPWPNTVRYWIQPYQGNGYGFAVSQAQRVSYGPATWDEGGFNLRFQRVWNAGDSSGSQYGGTFIGKGQVSQPDNAAEIGYAHFGSTCNVDQGNHIIRAWTTFNRNFNWHHDCQAAPTTCQQNQMFDLHAVSTHETGHWFWMSHLTSAQYSSHAMWHQIVPGQTSHRTLGHHDINTAYLMYGYR